MARLTASTGGAQRSARWLLMLGVIVAASVPANAQPSRSQNCRAAHRAQCVVEGEHGFRAVSAGVSHTCALGRDGSAWCWGDGRTGAVGDGAFEVRWQPVRVQTAMRFREVSAGDGYTCARSVQDEVHCWGSGPPIPGYPTATAIPLPIEIGERAISIVAGRRHACAIGESGSVWCWGRNIEGETGIGTSGVEASLTPEPTRMVGTERFATIAAGLDFTCAATRDGAVRCWGSNVDGVLGASAPERCGDVAPLPCASRPQPIPVPVPIDELSAGYGHVCGRSASGGVWCWGANAAGQISAEAGDRVTTPLEVDVPGGDARHVSAGGVYTCVLSGRGVQCWGGDTAELSAAEPLAASAPSDLATPGSYVAVSVGGAHICAIQSLGRVQRLFRQGGATRCWGDNSVGALGAR